MSPNTATTLLLSTNGRPQSCTHIPNYFDTSNAQECKPLVDGGMWDSVQNKGPTSETQTASTKSAPQLLWKCFYIARKSGRKDVDDKRGWDPSRSFQKIGGPSRDPQKVRLL